MVPAGFQIPYQHYSESMSKTTLRNYLDHQIPAELRDLARWCNWRLDDRGKKQPLDGASYTDPTTWISYEDARERWLTNGEAIKGLWFATGPVEDGDELAIGGFDFDHCTKPDGEITNPKVEDIVRRLGTYAEYSPTDGIREDEVAPRDRVSTRQAN